MQRQASDGEDLTEKEEEEEKEDCDLAEEEEEESIPLGRRSRNGNVQPKRTDEERGERSKVDEDGTVDCKWNGEAQTVAIATESSRERD